MNTLQTRQQTRQDREGSYSSTRSFADYDTDEVRRKWRLSPAPRARSLTRDEAREIIERQSSGDFYTGYTYGDSISYRSDGSIEYLHPYLNHRKRLDFGTDGDVKNYKYQSASPHFYKSRSSFYKNAWDWTSKNGLSLAEYAVSWLISAFFFILKQLASFVMFLGSLAHIAYQRAVPYISRKLAMISSSDQADKRPRSPRGRRRVSFASSPNEESQLSFRQTSTPISSLSVKPVSPNLIQLRQPLHVYAWSATEHVWETIKTVVTFAFDQLESTFSWAYDKISGIGAKDASPKRRSRGRPPKVVRVEESGPIYSLKSAFYSLVDSVSSSATYIQKNYTSAHKSRSWWPLLLLLALLALGTYGYYNKQHNNRGITTALQQDFHVARQWTISKINNAYNSLPSPVGIFKSAIDYSRNFVYNFGSFIGDVISSIGSFIFNFWAGILNRISWAWQSMRRWFSNIPNPLNYLPNFSKIIGNVTESIKSIFNFFIDIFVTLARSIYSGFQNITNRVSSAFSTTYSYIPSSSNVVGKVSQGSKSIFSTASTFASNVFSSITGFFGKIFEGLKTLAYNILSLVFHLFSSISQFVVKIFERIKALAYNTLNFISDTFLSIAKFADKGLEGLKELVYNIFTFLYDAFWYIIKSVQNAVSAIVQHVYHFFRVLYQWITNKFTELYGYLPDFSNISNVISEKTHNVLSYVSNSYNNFYTSVTKWAHRPKEEPRQKEIVERVIVEKSIGLDLTDVEKLIHEKISQYDADKTGQPDYALESSGGSIVGIGCTKVYEETSRLQSIFGIPLHYATYGPRTVIQRRANSPTAGECWPYIGGHGQLRIKLSHKINVTSVSYEHLSPRLSPEGHMKTAPNSFNVWSIHNHGKSDERKHMLGDYVYVDGGEALQTFETQFSDPDLTDMIELETFTNHGSPVTCLYRFRVHGQPALAQAEPV